MAQKLYSVCAHDCPDACSIEVDVEDGRAVRLRGNPEHPVTRGFLCGKVARYLDRVYSPDRLTHPSAAPAPRARDSSSPSLGTRLWTRLPRACTP